MKITEKLEIHLEQTDEEINKILKEYEKFIKEYSFYIPSKEEMLYEIIGSILLWEKEIELYSSLSQNWERKIFKLNY